MARNPSVPERGPGGGAGPQGRKAPPDDAAVPGRGEGGAAGDDPVAGGSADPWAEADAPHPDENAMDSPDLHPQPEDEATRNPGADRSG